MCCFFDVRSARALVGSIAFACFSSAGFADTLTVPGDFPSISAAVGASVDGDEIVLSDGTYTGAANSNIRFNGRAITIRSENGDPERCVVDCESVRPGFLFVSGEGASSRLEGIKIVRGRGLQGRGGGVFINNASPSIDGCVIEDCETTTGAGGMLLSGSSAVVYNTVFRGNRTRNWGGAVEAIGGNARLVNCRFIENVSNGVGGAIELGGARLTLDGCMFVRNEALGQPFGFNAFGGGAVGAFNGSNLTLNNCTLAGNRYNGTAASQGGGGVFSFNSTVRINNSILWGNTTMTPHSVEQQQIRRQSGATPVVQRTIVQGLDTINGVGNLGSDPLFTDALVDDYRPGEGSPAIDAGSNALVPAGLALDLDGEPRFVDIEDVADTGEGSGPIVDLGAFEANAPEVCPGDCDGSGDVSFQDLVGMLFEFGVETNGGCDADGSGEVSFADLVAALFRFGPC